jgi:hypothetical protein
MEIATSQNLLTDCGLVEHLEIYLFCEISLAKLFFLPCVFCTQEIST